MIADLKEAISMDGGSDLWGSAMSWGFAACTWAETHGIPVPSELGFSAGMAYETDSYEYEGIDSWATGEDLVFPGVGEDAVKDAMHLALKVLNRYLNLLKLAGLDY
jgi:hypothetical protein